MEATLSNMDFQDQFNLLLALAKHNDLFSSITSNTLGPTASAIADPQKSTAFYPADVTISQEFRTGRSHERFMNRSCSISEDEN